MGSQSDMAGIITRDEAALDELATFLGVAELTELVVIFVESTHHALGLLRATADPDEIGDLAHDLKGMAGSVGCHGLARLAAGIEVAAKATDLAAVAGLMDEVEEMWHATQGLLDRKFGVLQAAD